MRVEEGDGRCVRASWPCSIELSILGLLLNPPLTSNFIEVVVGYCSVVRKCSPFLSTSWTTP